jgi:hypothetical protein
MLRHLALAGVLAVTATACGDKNKKGAASKKKKDDEATEKLITDQQRKNAQKPAAPGEPK